MRRHSAHPLTNYVTPWNLYNQPCSPLPLNNTLLPKLAFCGAPCSICSIAARWLQGLFAPVRTGSECCGGTVPLHKQAVRKQVLPAGPGIRLAKASHSGCTTQALDVAAAYRKLRGSMQGEKLQTAGVGVLLAAAPPKGIRDSGTG